MANFSNGTWTLDDNTGIIRAANGEVAQVFGATRHNHEDNAREAFANARLIMNAPVLFEMLKNAVLYDDFDNVKAYELLEKINGGEISDDEE